MVSEISDSFLINFRHSVFSDNSLIINNLWSSGRTTVCYAGLKNEGYKIVEKFCDLEGTISFHSKLFIEQHKPFDSTIEMTRILLYS